MVTSLLANSCKVSLEKASWLKLDKKGQAYDEGKFGKNISTQIKHPAHISHQTLKILVYDELRGLFGLIVIISYFVLQI